MRNFNREINVTIQVDSIAYQLLENMDKDFKHKELVVETLIGRLIEKDESGLSRLYNALNGFENKINFKIGEKVKLKDYSCYAYWTPESVEKNNTISQKVETGTIIDINTDKDNPICVQFLAPNKKGELEERTEWFRSHRCDKMFDFAV